MTRAFDLIVASSLSDALDALASSGPGARIVAGGTDLVPNLKQGLVPATHLVSLARIGQCRGVAQADGQLVIGALECHAALASHPLILQHAPALARACSLIAGPALRRMGTLGGNICLDTRCAYYNQTEEWRRALGYCLKRDGDRCHVVEGGRSCVAAHCADAATVLLALDATVEIVSRAGVRLLPIADLLSGHQTRREGSPLAYLSPHCVGEGEILTRVFVPIHEVRLQGFEKLRMRESIDFPIASVAWSALPAADGIDVTLVLSALSARPRVLRHREVASTDAASRSQLIESLVARARDAAHPLACLPGDIAWRREMVGILLARSLTAGLASWPS